MAGRAVQMCAPSLGQLPGMNVKEEGTAARCVHMQARERGGGREGRRGRT